MNRKLKPIVNPAYSVEKFNDEILLYTKAGTKAVYLNDTAYGVWLLCKEDLTVGQIIDCLEQVYPEHVDQIREDVIAALETLVSNNVIELFDAE